MKFKKNILIVFSLIFGAFASPSMAAISIAPGEELWVVLPANGVAKLEAQFLQSYAISLDPPIAKQRTRDFQMQDQDALTMALLLETTQGYSDLLPFNFTIYKDLKNQKSILEMKDLSDENMVRSEFKNKILETAKPVRNYLWLQDPQVRFVVMPQGIAKNYQLPAGQEIAISEDFKNPTEFYSSGEKLTVRLVLEDEVVELPPICPVCPSLPPPVCPIPPVCPPPVSLDNHQSSQLADQLSGGGCQLSSNSQPVNSVVAWQWIGSLFFITLVFVRRMSSRKYD